MYILFLQGCILIKHLVMILRNSSRTIIIMFVFFLSALKLQKNCRSFPVLHNKSNMRTWLGLADRTRMFIRTPNNEKKTRDKDRETLRHRRVHVDIYIFCEDVGKWKCGELSSGSMGDAKLTIVTRVEDHVIWFQRTCLYKGRSDFSCLFNIENGLFL